MAIRLVEINKENLNSILNLKVSKEQDQFVADNAWSVAQGSYDELAWFRGIFNNDTPVGFVMLSLDEAKADYYLWRYMIDEKHQGKGYGKAALEQIISMVKALPEAKSLTLSYVPAEGSPAPFYEKLGFIDTGEWDREERIMRLDF